MAQLKRRNTLKDGIIMIQTLLIILFIIVPIFLLLDKVTLGAGEAATGQAGHGQGLHFPSPRACPSIYRFSHSFIHQLFSQSAPLPPTPDPWPLTLHPGPISPALPSLGRQWMGVGEANTLLSVPHPPG